jgi:hypothetical protein
MPVLISMASTFFYVVMRERITFAYLILTLISVFLLISCRSTTAIIAFILTILFYEVYTRENYSFIFLFIAMIFILLTVSDTLSFVYRRLLSNLNDPGYFATFFNYSVLFTPENLPYLIYGKWSWSPTRGASSHVDLMNIVVVYGGIVAYLLYRRILFPLSSLKRTGTMWQRTYSLVVLTAFICLFHSSMTLNINNMMLVTLLMVKSSQIHNSRGDGNAVEMALLDKKNTERNA